MLAACMIVGWMYAVSARAQSWLDLNGDDGKPVPNMRVPVELTTEIDRLKGVNAIGATNPDVTIVEFMDYNCPFCRKAAGDLEQLARENPGLRIKFVQNAITSKQSEEAARIDLAAFRIAGAAKAYELHRRLYTRRGVNDEKAALGLGSDLGLDGTELQKSAGSSEIDGVLKAHMKLAASLGLNATPSFIINGMKVSGYPGPKTMQRIIESVMTCDALTC